LFESAKDGILILDAETLVFIDANQFTQLHGYSYGDLTGRELWEIGIFGDRSASQAAYAELQDFGYVRYDCLPLKTSAEVSSATFYRYLSAARIAKSTLQLGVKRGDFAADC
jgi:hypothetical protein